MISSEFFLILPFCSSNKNNKNGPANSRGEMATAALCRQYNQTHIKIESKVRRARVP